MKPEQFKSSRQVLMRLILLAGLVLAAQPTAAASNHVFLTLTGNGSTDGFGYIVETGDVNGDGYDDLVVNGRYDGADGKAFVYFGGPSVDDTADLVLTQVGPHDGNHYSSGLSLGDLNGDGHLDIAVGAQYYDPPPFSSGYNSGAVFIYHGGPSLDATADLSITGPFSDALFGCAVSAEGDVNGDGYDDLAVGAMHSSISQPGRAYLFLGGQTMDTVADLSLILGEGGDDFGTFISIVGDVDDDGYDDLVVSAPAHDAGGPDSGRVVLYLGGATPDPVVDLTFDGEATNDYLAWIGGAGDVNGDDYADFLLGTVYHDAAGVDAGRAYLHLGSPTPDNVADLIFDGEAAGDHFGTPVTNSGDLDGDGYDDILLGARYHDGAGPDAGRAYLYRGSSTPDATPDLVIDGDPAYIRFGSDIAMGDIDGDGRLDMVIGEVSQNPSHVYVLDYAPNILCGPDPLEISLADDQGGGVYTDTAVVTYTGNASGPVYGYSIDVTWDPAVISATASDFAKPDTGPFSTTTWFIPTDVAAGHVNISAALPGGSVGTTGDDLFQVTFTAVGVPDHATSDLTLTLNSLRDADNVPLTDAATADAGVIVDLVAPAVSGVSIANTTLTHTDDYLKNGDAITVTATVSDGDPVFGTDDFSADLSGFGGAADAVADTWVAGTATWLVPAAACTPADGTVTVAVDAADGLGNAATDDDTIIADNTAPTAVTGLAAAPGHKKVELTWIDAAGQDTHYDGVIIRYAAWGDYPEYTTAAPAYPDSPAAGDGTVFDGTGDAATHAFVTDDRDIYAYSAYVYDLARNYSPAATSAQDIATNYWLGDVGAGAGGPYNGLVDVADYTGLASSYGLNEGDGGWKPECDVGPTDDHSGVGLPEPDDQVQFEDLIIFAMNAGVASGKHLAPTGTPEPMLAWERVDATTWSLRLREPCADLKGVNVAAQLPAGSATVSPGALLAQQEAPTFLQNIDRHGLDVGLALLGRGLGFLGSGELLRVRTAEEVDLTGAVIMARGIENTYYGADPVPPGDQETPPVRLSLAQNMPNPFNPSTKIVFSLPEAQPVRLTIYTPDGKRVRTLVSELRTAGVHEVIWNGRDDRGRMAASGTYLYRLQAGPYGETRKMSLMK